MISLWNATCKGVLPKKCCIYSPNTGFAMCNAKIAKKGIVQYEDAKKYWKNNLIVNFNMGSLSF